jgi:hypothetical protein
VTNRSGASVEATVILDEPGGVRTETLALGPWQLRVLDFATGNDGPAGRRAARIGSISIASTGPAGAVMAHGMIVDRASRYSAVVQLVDPATAKSSVLHGAGVRVGEVPQVGRRDRSVMLQPVVLARNIGSAPTTVPGRPLAPLRAPASSGHGLDYWIALYGAPRSITPHGGFRNPANNEQHATTLNGRHMYGDAADLDVVSNTQAEWTPLRDAAVLAGNPWVEPANGPCAYGCVHADWRYTSGSYR